MLPIKLSLLWHQHQPDYRDGNRFLMPWAWLHATKDYLEMAEHFERHTAMRGTINLVPSLLKQLQEYSSGDAVDPVVELMSKPAATLTKKDKSFLLEHFFCANTDRVISRSLRYRQLFEKSHAPNPEQTFEEQDYLDLAVHYSLAWTGEIARGREPFHSLIGKDRNFTEEEKQALAKAQLENVKAIIPLHKKLAELGQIELTTTPFYHPILPLLCDTNSALDAMPNVVLPQDRFQAPEEADEQLRRAREFFEREVGIVPKGMWPSEGSVSTEALALIRKNGFLWAATDEAVLSNTIGAGYVTAEERAVKPEHAKYFPWRMETPEGAIDLFFRDHRLSDDIGFTYQSWNANDAVNHFIENILRIREELIANYGDDVLQEACVSVILDGENCWEYYVRNGFEFLDTLYATLTNTPEIKSITFSEAMKSARTELLPTLSKIAAGSWIGGNFKIWIGHAEDNASWNALHAAKKDIEDARAKTEALTGTEKQEALKTIEAAHEELMIAEGSDWNWWYGDENVSLHNDMFDELYRSHLREVYRKLGNTPPKDLNKPIAGRFAENANADAAPKGGSMHRSS